jgi:uncharacterized protein (TIGR02231 family)
MWKRSMLLLALGGGLLGLTMLSNEMPAQPGKTKDVPGKVDKGIVPPAALKITPSKVTGVVVYPNSALVTREVEVPAGLGSQELTVTPLPATTINSSLYTEGADGIRVLSTRARHRPIYEDAREEVRKLQLELRDLNMAREKIEAELKAVQANSQTLTKMEGLLGVPATPSADKGTVNAENLIAIAKHIRDTRLETAKEVVNLQQQVTDNQAKAELAQRKLHEMSAGTGKFERDAVIVVDKTNAAAGKIRLNYLVDAASWLPKYKFRAGKQAKDQVQLEYLAAVMQNTGEDWSGVNLVLSTAQPMLNAAPPELQTLNVTVVAKGTAPAVALNPNPSELEEQVRNLRAKAQKDLNERKASSGSGLVNTAAALDQSWELLNPEAAIKRGCTFATKEGPTVTYHLDTKLTIPSRTEEQVIEVTKIDMPPEYYYKAVPILTPHVYRIAELTNRSNYVLLPGDATMYIGTDFVGQMNVPLVAIGEQFTVGFGVDPQLQVQRQLVDKQRTTQGGNQSLRFDYRILISSFKQERVKLQVWDRLPHAENDSVGVSLIKATPELSKDALYNREQRPNNLLRWDVNIDPGMNGEKATPIQYEFKLELDRQMVLGSFQSPGSFAAAPSQAPATLASINAADMVKINAEMAKLSPEDRNLAQQQVFCAIDQDSPLGSMGPIHKVMLKDKPVFVCCKGCIAEAKAHPDETLVQLRKLMDKKAARR